MIAVVLSWIVISFVLISFGDIFLLLFNKLCKKKEQYNFLDTFLLGMCLVTSLLSINSLWLPSNHYILFILLLISIIYWVSNKVRLYNLLCRIKALQASMPTINILFISIASLSILIYMLWAAHWFDATYYHYQNIRWNEEYAIVPGLGNLEERFGFNSNYFLLAAVFSFRFLFGEGIYGVQSTLAILFIVWMFVELVRSKYELKRILLLVAFLGLLIFNIEGLTDSSTDIIPNFCVFYLIARFILYPQVFKNSTLLYYILPICLVTYKLSAVPICLFGLIILINMFKVKDYRTFIFFIIIALTTIVPWEIRTVIISGYLVYPLSAIDIFSFDWKIPKSIVDMETANVSGFARYTFNLYYTYKYFFLYGFEANKYILLNVVMMQITCVIAIISPFVVGYRFFKKKYIQDRNYYLMYLVLIIYLLYWAILGPDPRFANGVLLGLSVLFVSILLPNKLLNYPKLGKYIALSFGIILLLLSLRRNFNYMEFLYPVSVKEGRISLSSVFTKPYSSKSQTESRNIDQKNYTIYKLGDLDIYITPDRNLGACYDVLPATSLEPLANQVKTQPLRTIEPRGKTLQDGFKPKEEYRN